MTYYLLLSFCAHMVGQEPECTEPYVVRNYETGRKEVFFSRDTCRTADSSIGYFWRDALRLTNQDQTTIDTRCVTTESHNGK